MKNMHLGGIFRLFTWPQFLLLLLLNPGYSYSQQAGNVENEIVVLIDKAAMEFPTVSGEVTPDKLNLRSNSLRSVFDRFRVANIRKAFPEFTEGDTVRILKDGRTVSIPRFSRIFVLTVPQEADVDTAIAYLQKVPGVAYAEKNTGIGTLSSDPDYSKQWYLHNTGQTGGTLGADMKAEEAWQITTGNPSTIIAVLDNGVDLTHDDLAGRVTGDGPDSFGDSHIDHGTRVAGIIGAIADNGKGGRGVNWNAQLISRKTNDGFSNQLSVQTVASKITDAVNSGASILNCSWASTSESQTIHMAFKYAYKMDRLSVVAMGNGGGGTPNYPAAYGSGVVSVGATQDNDTRASYSNTGAWVDVVAPGGTHISGPYDQHDIWSTMTNDSYGYDCGTSMAAPVVTGVASLLVGYNTTLSNDDLEHIIQLSADKLAGMSGADWTDQYGYGRVNARKALDLIRSPYIVNHYSASGGTDFSSSGVYSMAIFGANGLADGAYQVRRHEVRRGVTFSAADQIHVWGRGVYSTGWRDEGNVNYSVGWCDVVPGTVTSNSATLRTYVYEVWTIQGLPKGWYPTSPQNTVFAYTVHGVPVPTLTASMSGPTRLSVGQQGTWTVSASGGTGSYSYVWYFRSNDTGGQWFGPVTTSSSFTSHMYDYDGYLDVRVDVTSGSQQVSVSRHVACSDCSGGPLTPQVTQDSLAIDSLSASIAGDIIINQNYPNPFNPTTQIRFTLLKPNHVTLVVYDMLGREVARLADEHMAAGYHAVTWNAGGKASGVYIYRLEAGNTVQVERMILMK